MPTTDPYPPLLWDVDLYLDEPGSNPTMRWRGVSLLHDTGQDVESRTEVVSTQGEVQTTVRPLRTVFDYDVITVVGVQLTLSADGELVPTENLVSLSARPVISRVSSPPITKHTWPPASS